VDSFRDNLLRHRRDLHRGFGGAFSAAFELALTPAVFAGLGYLLDGWLGLFPVFTLGLLGFALVGMFVRAWYAYDAQMRAHEAGVPGVRPDPGATRG